MKQLIVHFDQNVFLNTIQPKAIQSPSLLIFLAFTSYALVTSSLTNIGMKSVAVR